ncbi:MULTISPECIES: DUF2213 domain-containing protein [unclassified Gilliamella]|uniref:DUF2213 domain-containing protein n=1 Tax=unclassified Gilliamella TaxID=2685620 RepID=UPI00226A0745|nr:MULTISPECIES: DUF2213 domain-containing protein [unclassified Gilliamella]MCX8597666.1 DUF2213 domain-containing protein [Gilliamella sp. B3493]MCX8599104.1 DUF2213 domain-containing protein [Gilliamella sp. B3486]MCX8675901.1 DUF2213 domain-containing protein [Gilliamella sp. B3023]MCX8688886.1 DUF2213 domain-containing protein [Gilliamella sp. B2973]MCX8704590.1 DUF2213 domain-containing protein [Gilliamella sp. B3127]
MTLKSVNVLSVVNSKSKISTQIIDGKEHIVINDVVPIVDDIVMNGIFYPADEINKSYMTLNDNLMPLDHPRINNEHVSALNPQAINNFYIGAWGRNVRKSNDRVLMDAYIDRKFAESTEKGRMLVNRLDDMMNGKNTTPIHVSTGLTYTPDNQSGSSKGKRYKSIARNMKFDHVAILPDKQGAATPDDGVGIFVNSDGEKSPIENVSLIDCSDDSISNVISKTIKEVLSVFKFNQKEEEDLMKEKILLALNAAGIKTDGLSDEQLLKVYNEQTTKEAIEKKKASEEEEKKKAEQEKKNATNAEDAPAWAKSLMNKVTNLELAVNANTEKELSVKREAVKAKFNMTQTAVNALSSEPLDALYAQCVKTAPISGGFANNSDNSLLNMEAPE